MSELNAPEGAWLLVALVGLVYALLNLQAARADITAAKLVKNFRHDTRLVIAHGAVLRNSVRVVIFACWLGLGIAYGFFEPPREAGLLGFFVLLVGAVGFAFNGVQESRERVKIAALLAEDMEDKEAEDQTEAVAVAEAALEDKEEAKKVEVAFHELEQSANERTAANTERIADNTEKERTS